MGANLSGRVFLIVDDHNFSRITVLRLLKNMGNPETHSATNGLEALSILEQEGLKIDCVIADFNMPVMHGLLLLKNIRTGYQGIRSNMPVLMLTGHGDTALVELAIQLDVNSFILKPVTKQTLDDRLQRVFGTHNPLDFSGIKSAEEYEALDVDTRIRDILKRNAASQVEDSSIVKETKAVKSGDDGEMKVDDVLRVNVNLVKPGFVLARPVLDQKLSQIFLREGVKLDEKMLYMLRDLADVGMIDPVIAISKPSVDSSGGCNPGIIIDENV